VEQVDGKAVRIAVLGHADSPAVGQAVNSIHVADVR
jgi:hypothetical protein